MTCDLHSEFDQNRVIDVHLHSMQYHGSKAEVSETLPDQKNLTSKSEASPRRHEKRERTYVKLEYIHEYYT